jgi:hypothetical protein
MAFHSNFPQPRFRPDSVLIGQTGRKKFSELAPRTANHQFDHKGLDRALREDPCGFLTEWVLAPQPPCTGRSQHELAEAIVNVGGIGRCRKVCADAYLP